MYKIITIDFNGFRTEQARTDNAITAKQIYESYIARCLHGFVDIMEVLIETETEVKSSFINWRRA